MNEPTAREAEIAALREANRREFVAAYGENPTKEHIALTTLALLDAGLLPQATCPIHHSDGTVEISVLPNSVRLPGGGVQTRRTIRANARKAARH